MILVEMLVVMTLLLVLCIYLKLKRVKAMQQWFACGIRKYRYKAIMYSTLVICVGTIGAVIGCAMLYAIYGIVQ